MSKDEIADSTDWLSTPLAALTPLESALRCQICKDFYETPMITTCSHTFCSLCIRRALSAEGKCPLCRNNEQELKLRSNWSMEEAVEAFKKARPDVLALARKPQDSERSPKRKAEYVDDGERPVENKRLRSSARLSRSRQQTAPSYAPEEVEEDEVIPDSEHEDEYVPEPADGLVPCPMCQKRMKEWQVFAHLETCPGPDAESEAPAPKRDAITQLSAPRQHQKTLDRLPALNYGMYKDNALRKKLQELGLSSYGPRPLMEKRHKEWITLWNANCDAARPKKRSELLQDLEMWERTQGGRASTMGKAAQNAALIKDKGFDGGAWAAKHDTSFRDLIANARKSVQAKKTTQEEGPEQRPESSETATNGSRATPNGTTVAGEPGSAAWTTDSAALLPNKQSVDEALDGKLDGTMDITQSHHETTSHTQMDDPGTRVGLTEAEAQRVPDLPGVEERHGEKESYVGLAETANAAEPYT